MAVKSFVLICRMQIRRNDTLFEKYLLAKNEKIKNFYKIAPYHKNNRFLIIFNIKPKSFYKKVLYFYITEDGTLPKFKFLPIYFIIYPIAHIQK